MSPASYKVVNFRLRPAKATERRMIVELCGHLGAIADLQSYRYVGLGSIYFNDFVLMHKLYGMTNMICIEREVGDRERFIFNKPYDNIQIEWGETLDVLPALPWRDVPSIVWMDYDDHININMLADLGAIVPDIEPQSLAIFTLRSNHKDFDDDPESEGTDSESPESKFERFTQAVGGNLPPGTTETDLKGQGRFQKVIREVFDAEIQRLLSERNAGVPEQNHVKYTQLLNFTYADGVPMTTIGGIFHRTDQDNRMAQCNFDSLAFVRSEDDPYEIKVPMLTLKEQGHLNSQLPDGNGITSPGVPPNQIEAYAGVYRYYPTFVEADL